MDECSPVSGVVTLTGERIVGHCGLSSPQAWTSVVRVASVKLSGMYISLILQAKFDVSGEGSL